MNKSSLNILIFLLGIILIGCKEVAKVQPNNPKPKFPLSQDANTPQEVEALSVESEIEVKKPVTNKIKYISFDFLNSLLKMSTKNITNKLSTLDPTYWKYSGKTANFSGEIWENKRAGQSILKMSDTDISLLDYSHFNMDTYNLLMKEDAFQNEDKSLGHTYFNYKDRFIQWKKIENNGTMINVLDME
jgi:hypothetical protein